MKEKITKDMIFTLLIPLLIIIGVMFLFGPVLYVEDIGNLTFIDLLNNGKGVSDIFGPIFIWVISLVILFFFGYSLKKKKLVNYGFIFVLIMFFFSIFYKQIVVNANEIESATSYGWGYYVFLSFLLLSVPFALYLIFGEVSYTTREIPEIAIFISVALILDRIPKINIGATGGSISLTMLPLFIIALRYPFLKSFISIGIIYGLISCQIDGYGFQTYPFDYLLGYGLISLASLFRGLIFEEGKKIRPMNYVFLVIAILVGGIGRMLGSTLSSMVLYGYPLDGALLYNLIYIGPSTLLAIIFMVALFVPFKRINERYVVS